MYIHISINYIKLKVEINIKITGWKHAQSFFALIIQYSKIVAGDLWLEIQ